MTAEWEYWGMFGIVVLVSNLCYMALVLSGQLNQHRLQAMEALKNHQRERAPLNLPPEPHLVRLLSKTAKTNQRKDSTPSPSNQSITECPADD